MHKTESQEKKEPLKLKVIIPLIGIIVVLALVMTFLNLGKPHFADATTPELHDSFQTYVTKSKNLDHYRLFTSEKVVTWSKGPSLKELLQDVDGSSKIESVTLKYRIPVFINLAGDWTILRQEDGLEVRAPMPTFGEAVFDPTSLDVKYSANLDEDQKDIVKDALKESLSAYRVAIDSASRQALEEESRLKVQELLNTWLQSAYSELPEIKYHISFSGSTDSEVIEEP